MLGKMPDVVEEIAELARFWTEESRKAQEMFLQANVPAGPDRNDEKIPRYPVGSPPVLSIPFDNGRSNMSKEVDLVKLLYGRATEESRGEVKNETSSSSGSQLKRLGESKLWPSLSYFCAEVM